MANYALMKQLQGVQAKYFTQALGCVDEACKLLTAL
jgi:hypothetical protein